MTTRIRHRLRGPAGLWEDERGIAFAAVALLGAVLVFLSALVAIRTFQESGNINQDRFWEQSMQIAEGGLDTALEDLYDEWDTFSVAASDNGSYSAADFAEREDIIALADTVDASDDNFYSLPEGDVVVLMDPASDALYSVGFSPDRDDPNREIRIVEAQLGIPSWSPEVALLVGADLHKDNDPTKETKPALKLESKKKDKDVDIYGSVGGLHVNGTLEFKDHKENEYNITGCLTALDYKLKDDKLADKFYSNQDSKDCPKWNEVEPLPIPEIDPLKLHYLSQYDVCPDSFVRYGPAADVDDSKKATRGVPCTGDVVTGVIWGNIKHLDEWDKKIEFKWEKDKDFHEGVYFLWGRSAKIEIKEDLDVELTVIAAKPNNDLTCDDEDIDKDQFGDFEVKVEKGGTLKPHPTADPYTLITAGDIKMEIKGKVKKDNSKDDRGTVFGLFAAHEQIKIESNDADELEPKGGINGAIIAEHACDTHDSKQKEKSEFKKGDIRYSGEITTTDFVIKDIQDGYYGVEFASER